MEQPVVGSIVPPFRGKKRVDGDEVDAASPVDADRTDEIDLVWRDDMEKTGGCKEGIKERYKLMN
jgi:hypothetical protein